MKKTFKDFAKNDIDQVFVNQNEFAETVIINGEEMVIVRDNDIVNQSDTGKQLTKYDVLFHVSAEYFQDGLPQPEMLMEFDNEEYRIEKVDINLGMLTIGLSRYDA